jgi:hypothetical protein
VDELYVGSFDGFVARRDALAKQLRDQGDAEEATRVRSLKKPNRVAWALNQLGAQEPGLRDAVLDAGKELRSAQEALVSGKGDHARARKAQEAERRAVQEALAGADAIAQEDGAALGAGTERARQTLHAVALDDDVREQFASARLTTHHEAVGLGPVAGAAQREPAKKSGADRRRRAEREAAEKELDRREQAAARAREELGGARKRAERAQKELERAASELEDAEAAAEEAKAELKRLGGQDD